MFGFTISLSKRLNLWWFLVPSSVCWYWKRSVLWNGKGLACETIVLNVETVEAWAESVWYVGVSYVVKFYCCWTWQIWIVFYVEGCILFSVHLVGVNRLGACREFCGVHSWQNGTRCRDGVKLLWCHSHLVWLVFEGSIPTCACFHSENVFVTCSCCFFFLVVY